MLSFAAVPYATHGFNDVCRFSKPCPQAFNVRINSSVVAIKLVIPDGTEKFLTGANTAGVFHEILQEAELYGCKFYWFIMNGDFMCL